MISAMLLSFLACMALFVLAAFLVGVLKGYYFGNASKKREKDGN